MTATTIAIYRVVFRLKNDNAASLITNTEAVMVAVPIPATSSPNFEDIKDAAYREYIRQHRSSAELVRVDSITEKLYDITYYASPSDAELKLVLDDRLLDPDTLQEE